MSSAPSLAAEPGKRLWAGGFDFLVVSVIFLVVGVTGEGLGFNLARWVVFAFIFFAYHFGCLVARDGRTLGKTAADICVLSIAGQPLTATQCLMRAGVRTVPFLLFGIGEVPIGMLVGGGVLLALVLAEFHLLERGPYRQTVADSIAHSLVVNLPPLQAHRAPAGPMFSPTDAEFGIAPHRPRKDDSANQSLISIPIHTDRSVSRRHCSAVGDLAR